MRAAPRVPSWHSTPFPRKLSACRRNYFNGYITSDKASPSALHSNYKCRKHNSQSNHIKKGRKWAIKMQFLPGKSTFPSQARYTHYCSCLLQAGSELVPGHWRLQSCWFQWQQPSTLDLLTYQGLSSAQAFCCVYWWLANIQDHFFWGSNLPF